MPRSRCRNVRVWACLPLRTSRASGKITIGLRDGSHLPLAGTHASGRAVSHSKGEISRTQVSIGHRVSIVR